MFPWELGYVVVDGCRFQVVSVYLAGGEFRSLLGITPCRDRLSGQIQLYGPDGELVARGKTVIIPPHTETVRFAYGFRITDVSSAGEVLDVSTLPGWPSGAEPDVHV